MNSRLLSGQSTFTGITKQFDGLGELDMVTSGVVAIGTEAHGFRSVLGGSELLLLEAALIPMTAGGTVLSALGA